MSGGFFEGVKRWCVIWRTIFFLHRAKNGGFWACVVILSGFFWIFVLGCLASMRRVGDFGADCAVDFIDYAILTDYWLMDELLVVIAIIAANYLLPYFLR